MAEPRNGGFPGFTYAISVGFDSILKSVAAQRYTYANLARKLLLFCGCHSEVAKPNAVNYGINLDGIILLQDETSEIWDFSRCSCLVLLG